MATLKSKILGLDIELHRNIDDGTLCRGLSQIPGPVCRYLSPILESACTYLSQKALLGAVVNAQDGAGGFHTADFTLNKANLIELRKKYSFCVGYVSLTVEHTNDLNAGLVQDILDCDLSLMVVQHALSSKLNGTVGTFYGQKAASNAKAAQVPSGVTLFCDLEEASENKPRDIIDYCNNWLNAVANGGYRPGLYVGSNCGLSKNELSNLKFTAFWKCGNVPKPDQGFAMEQITSNKPSVYGGRIDEDLIYNGSALFWHQRII